MERIHDLGLRMPLRSALDRLYRLFNRREFVHPDPLEILYTYPDPRDREVVGIIAASLAYGRVGQILDSAHRVLYPLGPRPAAFLAKASARRLESCLRGFKHRFTGDKDMLNLLLGVKRMLADYGSLEKSFIACMCDGDQTTFPAVQRWASLLVPEGSTLVPKADCRSAFKRIHLYLRWMVRRDDVDPGGWFRVPLSMLVVPLDTHMARIARLWRMSTRASVDAVMALEVTAAFRKISPEDPVRYDFVLTRFGINPAFSSGHLSRLFHPGFKEPAN